jgi:hypothetical protein
MRVEPGRSRPLTPSAGALLLVMLAACDQIDVTSSAEPPSARCVSCHLPDYLAAQHPPHNGVKPDTCATCHGQASFHPARVEHSFPLEGAHAEANCFACHGGVPPIFEGTAKSCAVCHAADHERANASVSKHAAFGDDCAHCHGTSKWKPTLDARPVNAKSAPTTAEQPAFLPTPAEQPHTTAKSPPLGLPVTPTAVPTPTVNPEPTATASKRKRPDSVSGASPASKPSRTRGAER